MAKKHEQNVLSLLQRADLGELLQDADNILEKIVEGVATEGGSGEINIKIKVKRMKGKDAAEIEPIMTYKLPPKARMSAVFFITPENRLSTKHGSQPSIPGVDDDDDEVPPALSSVKND